MIYATIAEAAAANDFFKQYEWPLVRPFVGESDLHDAAALFEIVVTRIHPASKERFRERVCRFRSGTNATTAINAINAAYGVDGEVKFEKVTL